MTIAALSRYTGAVVAAYCAIILTGQSPAYSAREELSEEPPTYSLAVAPFGKSSASEQFSLKDWLSDNGSGGFAKDFSDEDRALDEWETIPADTH